jgi:hypothetical protein
VKNESNYFAHVAMILRRKTNWLQKLNKVVCKPVDGPPSDLPHPVSEVRGAIKISSWQYYLSANLPVVSIV